MFQVNSVGYITREIYRSIEIQRERGEMEALKSNSTESKSFPMKGGDGPYSYINNSSFQRSAAESSKAMIEEAIAEELDLENLPNSSTTFRIVDLGCSVGPNTFLAVENIIKAVDLKFKNSLTGFSSDDDHQIPEFQVFFSDQTSNDFNTLFASLPPERRYLAAGVPGSFYDRLFPKGSLHFVYSSFALQMLSKVPKEVVDINSPAWNKGRIHYTNAPSEVVEAYSAQYVKDMEDFLHARAQEIVCGGLMAILVPTLPNGTSPDSPGTFGAWLDLLGSCLMDMSKMGIVSEAKVDSFNLHVYISSPHEVEALVGRNGCYNIERMEVMSSPLPNDPQVFSNHVRAGMEGMIQEHFGSEILDQLFDFYSKKLADCLSIVTPDKASQLFLLLKRNSC